MNECLPTKAKQQTKEVFIVCKILTKANKKIKEEIKEICLSGPLATYATQLLITKFQSLANMKEFH